MVIDKYYYKEATISTDKTDGQNVFNFNLIFGSRACKYFYIKNKDAANSVYMLLTDIQCYPGSEDIEIEAGSTWPPHHIDGFRCSGFRLVADTDPVIVQIFAMA